MKLEAIEYTAPAYWAPYLINGDASGFEDDEQAACDAWIDSLGIGEPVSCEPADEFAASHDAWQFWPYACATERYTFLVRSED